MVNNLYRCILVSILFFFSAPGLSWQPEGSEVDLSQREYLLPAEAAAFQDEDVIYLDVRSTLEWLGGHVEGAVHLPYDEVADEIASVLPDRSVPVIAYCGSGPRASFVIDEMRKQGYTVVPVVKGGYRELIENGMKKD